MTFKDFLFRESGGEGHGSAFFYGLQLYPSDAFDWGQAANEPTELYFLQKRWKIERKLGRKFHNIDEPKFQKTKYVSIQDTTDFDHPSQKSQGLKIVNSKIVNLAIGKDSKDRRELTTSNEPVSIDVDRIFGDKGTNSIPKLSKNFDEPWRR